MIYFDPNKSKLFTTVQSGSKNQNSNYRIPPVTRTAEYGKYTHRHSKAKRATGLLREKICSRRQAQQTVPPVPSAGKHRASTKCGKSCSRRQNVPPVQSAGKHVTATECGKKYRYQTRENREPIPGIGKHVTDGRIGKTYNRCQAPENTQSQVMELGKLKSEERNYLPLVIETRLKKSDKQSKQNGNKLKNTEK